MKPAMQVVQLRQQHIICGSPAKHAVKNFNKTEGIDWNSDGFDGNEEDM